MLEGGGMREFYTMGILDVFLDEKISFDYVVGVSAGACAACSYLSGQRGRNKRINTAYLGDKRFLSLRNFVKTGSLFGMDFVFDEIPKKLDPFDFEMFSANKSEFRIGVVDAMSGETIFVEKNDTHDLLTLLRASSSIPGYSPPVMYNGSLYFDGGMSEPIPVKRAFKDGCDKVVVILTRDGSYIKKKERFLGLSGLFIKKYPQMLKILEKRHTEYNAVREELKELEKQGTVMILKPTTNPGIGRFTKERSALESAYNLGVSDVKARLEEIRRFIAV